MKAEILSIGTELLLGEISDTNASFLATQLPALGIDLYWITQVGDNRGRLVEALKRAWKRSDLVLTTGGLGPTEDDITRESIAEMLGEELKVDPALERELQDFFARRNLVMPTRNIKQATIITSAQVLHNPRGTAPGWWVEQGKEIIVAMPGPPGEMQYMWETEVAPRLRQRVANGILLTRTLKTLGLQEAMVDEMVSPFLSSSNPTLGIYAKPDGIHLRLGAKAKTRGEAEEMLAQGEARLREVLKDHIWGVDMDTPEGIVGKLLSLKKLTLSTMEFGTGGLLAAALSSAPESSPHYRGGVVTNSLEIPIAAGVEAHLVAQFGTVSPEMAEAMAAAVRRHLGTDVGASITVVTGREEQEGKPTGTVFTAAEAGRKKSLHRGSYPPNPAETKRRAVTAALFNLRKLLLSLD